MIYDANTKRWRKGDIVIHDADAKEPKMLMVVIGYTRDDLCKTQYVDRRHKRTIWKNGLEYLHQPERFNIPSHIGKMRQDLIVSAQDEWERVRRWNLRFEPGKLVRTTSADGGFEAVTTTEAKFVGHGSARIRLNPGGEWLLKFVEVI